jgi:hypothetical protein
MKAQIPAQGILTRNDWGDAKSYQIVCECGNSDHEHNIWVESDETGVTVHTYTEQTTDYWSQLIQPRYNIDNTIYQNIHWFWIGVINDWSRRSKLIWQILTKGYIKYEATLSMDEQQDLNYAETLKSAVKDVKAFRSKNDPVTKAASKIANEGDCV